jgi:hypothetical protein
MTLEIIAWSDAYFDFEAPDIQRDSYIVFTVGWVTEISGGYIHIAGEKLPDGGYRSMTHVPVSTIVSRTTLSEEVDL